MLEVFDYLEDMVPTTLILYELLDNVLVLHLDIDRLIQHALHAINLVFLCFGKIYCLYTPLSHLLKLSLLLQYVITVFLSLSLQLSKLLCQLKMIL